uniref:Anther-specific proline-rich protein APG-like n=1 Tax=Saccoglossus kowalevskii TaxID=10224 RepID=A0ABM0M7Y8_SACKO
ACDEVRNYADVLDAEFTETEEIELKLLERFSSINLFLTENKPAKQELHPVPQLGQHEVNQQPIPPDDQQAPVQQLVPPPTPQVVPPPTPQVVPPPTPQVALPPTPQVVPPPTPQVVPPPTPQVVPPPTPQVVPPPTPQIVLPPTPQVVPPSTPQVAPPVPTFQVAFQPPVQQFDQPANAPVPQVEVTQNNFLNNSIPTAHISGMNPQYTQFNSVQLPRIDLPVYSGEYTGWAEFWDMFNAAVGLNPQLSPIIKFAYLKRSLEGEALEVITGLDLTI